MANERFLVIGAMGCLGAWVVRLLLDEGTPTVAFDLSTNDSRLRLIATDDELARITFVAGDITDTDAVARVVADHGITHVVHCAALQVPFVRADPPAGARVNVLGTVNVFEAVRRAQDTVRGFAYASSAAVFGPPERYPDGIVADDSPLYPEANLYGVFKQANEGTARIYAAEAGIASIGLRPFIVYGPGRDQGMTSTPTIAMAAAAAGRPYRINFGGSLYVNFAPDAAATFIAAARRATDGARVFNIPGLSVHMADIVDAIERAEPQAAGLISFEPSAPPSPTRVDTTVVNAALGPLPATLLRDGVARSMATFRVGLERGLVVPPGS